MIRNPNHPELSMDDWDRPPDSLWWDRLPDSCSLTWVDGMEGFERSDGFAFTTTYRDAPSPLSLEGFMNVSRAALSLELASTESRLKLHLRVEERWSEHCPPPRVWECLYETSRRAAQDFWDLAWGRGSYLWIISTVEFEGRLLVSLDSGDVLMRYFTQRTWQ